MPGGQTKELCFSMSDTQYPILWQPEFVHDVGRFREWLGQRDDLLLEDGTPIWWHLFEHNGWENIEELLAVSDQEHNVYLDWKDQNGRGWMWVGLTYKAPSPLVLRGMERLGRGWDQPDKFGQDPLSLATEGQCIHGIARRLWRLSPNRTQKRIDTLARLAKDPAARRAWQFWTHGIELENEPGK